MNIETSRISTIFGEDANSRVKTMKSMMSPDEIKKTHNNTDKVTDLNDWRYCNPDHLFDKLPQPYRY